MNKTKLQTKIQEWKKNSDNGTLSDDENPMFLFQMTSAKVLVEILNSKIDLNEFIKHELANRGLDNNGKWVGFQK